MSKNVPSNHEPPISPADWDAIVAAAFSPDAEPHVFSDRYQKQKQKQEELLMPKKSIRGRKTIVIAAILAAAVVAIPTSAYAVNRIYQASIQSTGSYQKDVVIDAGDSTLDTRTQSLQVGWMPDGMTLDKNSGKYHDDQNRGVTMLFWKMQDGDLLQTVNRGIVHSETETINGNQVFFLQRDSANLPDGQMDYRNIVWVAFSNTPYAAQFYATDDLTKEELTQIAEHLSLSPAEQETASLWQPEESLIESSGAAPATACDVNQLSYVNIGDTLTTEETVSLTLDALSTQNTFAGISTDGIGQDCDYSSYQNADGTIADNTRTWYSYGDGVNTLDEAIKTETIPQTILTFQLTYTNNGTEAVETCVCPQLFRMQADGTFPAYTEEAETEYYVDSCDLNMTGEFFSFSSSGSHSKNNVLLQPGETQTVTVAFVVDADQLDELYLVPAPHGYELPEEVTQSPILQVSSALNR